MKDIMIERVINGNVPAHVRRAINSKTPVLILDSCRKSGEMKIHMACYNMNEVMQKTALNTMLVGIKDDFGNNNEIKITQLI
jgi:hypothetical protein